MIDARGYSCPEPVIMLSKAIQSKDAEYDMIVDNRAAVENITRFADHSGYTVTATPQGEDFALHIVRK